jgi:hypothetical protein
MTYVCGVCGNEIVASDVSRSPVGRGDLYHVYDRPPGGGALYCDGDGKHPAVEMEQRR